MSIADIERNIVEEFALFQDWMEKYEYLIELGKDLPMAEEAEKNDSTLVKGCQSRVWLSCSYDGEALHFKADSDAIITKGMIALLLRVFDGQKPADILAADLGFIEEIGLKDNLTPTRANGLVSMIQKIRNYASSYC